MSRYRDENDGEQYQLSAGYRPVAYEADTQTYTYEGPNGSTVRGNPGNRYARPMPSFGVEDEKSAWRYLYPFFILVALFLWVVIAPPWKHNFGGKQAVSCVQGSVAHEIGKDESCWKIAQDFSTTVDKITELNPDLDCDKLPVGGTVCVPKMQS